MNQQQLLSTGFNALNRGDIKSAGEACQRLLAEDPNLVPAHFLVGLIALEGKQRQVAYKAFKSVVQLDRQHAAAWAQLARLHVSEGRIDAAEAALAEIRRIQPRDPVVLDLTGTVLNQLGEHEAAKAFFARVNTLAPSQPQYMLNLANVMVFLGEITTASQIFRDVIALDPDNPQAHWGLANAERARDHSHIDTMRGLLERRSHNPRARSFLNYAIGKCCEDLGDWPAAFAAFAAGAAARRETVAYDESAEIDMFATVRRIFTADWLSKRPAGAASSAPIFVLGQPRTGTTLIERIISSHSQVHSAGELQQFGLAIRRLTRYRNPLRFSTALFERAATLDPRELGELYLHSTSRHQRRAPRFVDKLPVNYLHIPLLLAALPNAKIVHLVRQPMDACFASFKQLFADAYLHSYDQQEMARHHARYRDLMAHFRREFPGRFIDISYEETAQNLEPNARGLIHALGLPWEDACLNFHENEGSVATASAVQVREPAHTRSIGRWRRYETQLQPMREALEAAGVVVE